MALKAEVVTLYTTHQTHKFYSTMGEISQDTQLTTPFPASGVRVPVMDGNEALDADKNKYVDLYDIGIGGGMTDNEKTMFNRLLMRQAEDDYLNSRTALGYKGGAYDIFADTTKIASQTDVTVSTLDGGDPQGKVELVGGLISGSWDVTTATFDGASFSVAAQDSAPYGIAFKPDGTDVYRGGFW